MANALNIRNENGHPPVQIPASVRGVNRIGRAFKGRVGPSFISLDPLELVRKAQRDTGLHAFPQIDWRTPFEKLMFGYAREANLSLIGRVSAREITLSALKNLLALRAELDRHPAIRDVSLQRPLIVVSLSRSGSTFLHKLLACHPDARSPRLWELQAPAPAPSPDTSPSDPRILACRKKFERFFSRLPDFRKIHDLEPMEPDECIHIFRDAFMCKLSFAVANDVPTYQRWVDQADFAPVYQHYKNVLQCLCWNFPGKRLILKSPNHMVTLAQLLEVFPDAGIVMLHRDPRAASASRCSMAEAVRMLVTNEYSLEEIGQRWMSCWVPVLNTMLEIRTKFPNVRFLDIDYRGLVEDPVGKAREIFETFDFSFDRGVESTLRNWAAAHSQGRHGAHRYSLERYGLSSEMVLGALKPYLSAFHLHYA